MNPTNNQEGWDQHRIYVLAELERAASNIHGLRGDIQALGLKGSEQYNKLMMEITALKAESKLGKWIIGGVGGGLVMLAVELFLKLVFHG